jgi:hypothetical protein
MNTSSKGVLGRFLARSSVELGARFPSPSLVKSLLTRNEIQLSYDEVKIIVDAVRAKAPCNFLVFGVGNDSRFWSRLNRGGNTVFIEDNEKWFHEAIKSDRRLRAYLVNFLTLRSQWPELIESPDRLDMILPQEIEREKWNVILVDGPNGYDDVNPGRMKSIFLASRLAANSGDVFVHDCHREVEQIFSDRFLKPENLKAEVGLLRHYHLGNSSA